mmetsp:Transcript_21816/g.34197  ORF Transcript_21816/g.34197 Transcript_21816/m.34197 type:complete len:281 (-) Transcript_21816:1114-1956(-)
MRKLIHECLSALSFIHERGVIHRSLGASSVSLNTFDVVESQSLEVKLQDFGFASRIAAIDDGTLRKARESGAVTPSQIQTYLVSEDIYAIGYAIAETVFGAFESSIEEANASAQPKVSPIMETWRINSPEDSNEEDGSSLGPVRASSASDQMSSPNLDQNSLKKLMEDVFSGDIQGSFRDYCVSEERWVDVVAFLDQENRAGWKLLDNMINCRRNPKDGQKSITELSDDDISDIVPSFLPAEVDLRSAPTARSLLDNALFSELRKPWWIKQPSDPMQLID